MQLEPQLEQMISDLVERFYARVRRDAALGPIFEDAIADSWQPHLRKLKDFWASAVFGAARYQGSPMIAHVGLPLRLTPAHFNRWLSLWRVTANEVCGPNLAPRFIARAEMMAERFLLGIEMRHQALDGEQA